MAIYKTCHAAFPLLKCVWLKVCSLSETTRLFWTHGHMVLGNWRRRNSANKPTRHEKTEAKMVHLRFIIFSSFPYLLFLLNLGLQQLQALFYLLA